MNKVYVISEIGCNHNGDINIALKMVDYLLSINVDCIKFQIFDSNELISKFAPKADYQIATTGDTDSQLEMTKKLELSHKDYISILEYIKSKNKDVKVFATPFDLNSIEFLRSIGQKIWKIPSGEITNYPYIEKLSRYNENDNLFLISTGMSTIREIKKTLRLLMSKGIKKNQIVIFHCNTEYPTPYEDVNLNVLKEFKKIFRGFKIGFSDHSENIYAPLAAIPYGITYIEKHFTLDKNMNGPDHKASMSPEEMKNLCEGVKAVCKSLGNKKKQVTKSEAKNINIARKSIVAKKPIKKGEVFSEENITTKRPGNGISAWNWNKVLGKTSNYDFDEDELIKL